MSHMTHTLDRSMGQAVQETAQKAAKDRITPVAYDASGHPLPTEEQITRVAFWIIMAASALFIGTTIFLSHM